MFGGPPLSSKKELASQPKALPVTAAARISIISASAPPLAPPIGSSVPAEGGLRVGGGLAVRIDRPVAGDRLAGFLGSDDLAASRDGHGEVDDQRRRTARQWSAERERVRAQHRLASAPEGHGLRRVRRAPAPLVRARRGARRVRRPARSDASGGLRRRRCHFPAPAARVHRSPASMAGYANPKAASTRNAAPATRSTVGVANPLTFPARDWMA